MPLLRDAEFLQQELLDEWYNDTQIAMQSIEVGPVDLLS